MMTFFKKNAVLLAIVAVFGGSLLVPVNASAATVETLCKALPFTPLCLGKTMVEETPDPSALCKLVPMDPTCMLKKAIEESKSGKSSTSDKKVEKVDCKLFPAYPGCTSTKKPATGTNICKYLPTYPGCRQTRPKPTTDTSVCKYLPSAPGCEKKPDRTPAAPEVKPRPTPTPTPRPPYKPADPCAPGTNKPCHRPTPTPSRPLPVLSCDLPRDIDSHWAEIYIRRLCQLGVMEGFNDGSFRPDQLTSRIEMTKMAAVSAKIQPNLKCWDADCGTPFNDLDFSWHSRWVRPAWDRGVVQGVNYNHFMPNGLVTREQATKIILASFGYRPLQVEKSFFNDVHGWSVGWIELAHQLGIVQGIGNGNFDPQRPITRAEAAKIMAKTIEFYNTKIR